jgi:hypothetical protein
MKKAVMILLCIALGVILVADSAGIFAAVSQMISLCLNTVIPSLFAFLVLSTFAVSSGLIRNGFAIFVLSLVGGYPVGAKLLSDSGSGGDSRKAAHLLMYCYCASPALLLAIVGQLGLYIWISNALACVIFAIAANVVKAAKAAKRDFAAPPAIPPSRRDSPEPPTTFGAALIHSVISAGSALYRVCMVMLVFAAGLRVLEFVGVMRLLGDYADIARALAEITNVAQLSGSAPAPLIAALTSLGGMCVLFQTAAIVRGRFGLSKFLLARIPIAALSAGICALICALIPTRIAVEAMTGRHTVTTASGSPLASVCLLIMVLLLAAACHPSDGKALDRDSLER